MRWRRLSIKRYAFLMRWFSSLGRPKYFDCSNSDGFPFGEPLRFAFTNCALSHPNRTMIESLHSSGMLFCFSSSKCTYRAFSRLDAPKVIIATNRHSLHGISTTRSGGSTTTSASITKSIASKKCQPSNNKILHSSFAALSMSAWCRSPDGAEGDDAVKSTRRRRVMSVTRLCWSL